MRWGETLTLMNPKQDRARVKKTLANNNIFQKYSFLETITKVLPTIYIVYDIYCHISGFISALWKQKLTDLKINSFFNLRKADEKKSPWYRQQLPGKVRFSRSHTPVYAHTCLAPLPFSHIRVFYPTVSNRPGTFKTPCSFRWPSPWPDNFLSAGIRSHIPALLPPVD